MGTPSAKEESNITLWQPIGIRYMAKWYTRQPEIMALIGHFKQRAPNIVDFPDLIPAWPTQFLTDCSFSTTD